MATNPKDIIPLRTKRALRLLRNVEAVTLYQNNPNVDEFVVMVTSATTEVNHQVSVEVVNNETNVTYCTCLGFGFAGHCHHEEPAKNCVLRYKQYLRNRAHSLIPLSWLLGANEPLGVA
jgi:hypothetical protein